MTTPQGSYQFESLTDRHTEAKFLSERAALRLDGFLDLIERHAPARPTRFLEIGCGHGIRTNLLATQYPQAQVIGIDRSDEMLVNTKCFHRSNLTFQQADLYHLPFANEAFDVVYARLVFMHLTDPLVALAEIKRVLKPGGRVVLEDADRDCMLFEPAPATFTAFWQKVQGAQRRLGGDPNVGRRLAPYLKQVGFQNLDIEPQPITGAKKEIEFLARTLMPSLNLYLDPQDQALGEQAISDLVAAAQSVGSTFYHLWFVASGEKVRENLV